MTTLVLAVSAFAADDEAPDEEDLPEVGFVCTPDEGGRIVGLAPLEINCVVDPPEVGTWDTPSWTFGEGTLVTGDEVSFVYDEAGQYTVSVQLDGFEGVEGYTDEPYHAEFGYVTVCAKPVVRFTYKNKGGLDFELINKTDVAINCIDDIRWRIFEGEQTKGEPKFVFDTWEPRVELPREGPWTVQLTVSGLAGSTTADLVIDARYKLTDDLTEGPKAHWCATSPAAGSAWMALAGLVLLVRRRR